MKNLPPLIVIPHSRITANGAPYTPQPAMDVLTGVHDTDAHVVPYVLPSGPTPRLRLGDLAGLIEAGDEPLIGWVFCDVDTPGHVRWTPDEAEAHWATIKGHPLLSAAGYYSTRAGYRLVFRLSKTIPASVASHYIEQFCTHLRAGGIPVDPHCVERWNTLYRLPRVRRDGAPLPAFVDLSGLETPLDWVAPLPLANHIPPKSATTETTPRPNLKPLGSLAWATIAGAGDAVAAKIDDLRAGLPIAGKGGRQNGMFTLAATIIGGLSLDDPDMVYQALAPSVAAAGGVSLDTLWERCCYLVGVDRAKRAARAEIQERVESHQPPLVYHGSSIYVYDTKGRTYRPPVPAVAVCQALEQWCQLPGLETRAKGGRPRGTADYLADYGRQAVDVIVEMGRKRGLYLPDINGGTLIDGCCRPADIPAVESPDVAAWLEALGGPHHGKLLDWVATVGRLDRPTCALYIQGPPGTGKGMFAAGVAALWGSGATSYADATGKFNGALTKNPIVLVDEMFQTYDGGDGFSAGFRSLIGESSRQLRRKNLPSATIRGCPRLVITANNGDALKLQESLTQSDLLAIAERILHVRHANAPRDYLRWMGGRDFTADWVLDSDGKPGAIAKHAVWLAETRRVAAGSRFLVEGILEDWHRDLMGNSGIQGATLAALAHFLDRDKPMIGIEVDVAAGIVYANAPSLRGAWGVLMGDQPPREGVLAKALRTLAGGAQTRRAFTGGRLRCYKIDLKDVLRRGEALQIGDVERFDALAQKRDTAEALGGACDA